MMILLMPNVFYTVYMQYNSIVKDSLPIIQVLLIEIFILIYLLNILILSVGHC